MIIVKKLIISIICLILLIAVGQKQVMAEDPPVLAFYYAWFDDNTWVSGQAADIPNPTYRSADAATIERHVAQAKGAGINAFVQSWYGPQIENNQTETNFSILLDTAGRHGFQAAVDVEVRGPFFPDLNAVQGAVASLLNTHIHHPAYLRYQGKPVIFFWRQQRFSVAQWAAIRQAVDPHHTTYWIAEGIDLSYQDVFDGHHLYSIAWAGSAAGELNKWPPRIKQVEARLGVDKLWVATVMPGYNDLNLPRADAFARSREGGAYYRQTWAAAKATNPDMIIITSFNEWLEGTQIEPSVTYGDFYLNLTRELVNTSFAVEPVAEVIVAKEKSSANIIAPETQTINLITSETEATVNIVVETPPQENNIESVPEVNVSSTSMPETVVYFVESGDTLYGIALAFGIAVTDIVALNGLDNADTLAEGQVLQLPMGNSIEEEKEALFSRVGLNSTELLQRKRALLE